MFTDSVVTWRWWWWRLLLEQIPSLPSLDDTEMILRIWKTTTELSHKLPLAEEVSERQFLFFVSFFPWPGQPLELVSFQVLLPQVATRSICSFCSPSLDYSCGGRHPSSFHLFPQCMAAKLSPFLCSVVSQPSTVCGLDRASVISHRDFQPPPMIKWMQGHILPTLAVFQALPQLLLVAVHRREQASALPGFEPSFLCFSRWTKKAWAMFALYLSRLICGFCCLSDHLAPFLYY